MQTLEFKVSQNFSTVERLERVLFTSTGLFVLATVDDVRILEMSQRDMKSFLRTLRAKILLPSYPSIPAVLHPTVGLLILVPWLLADPA